jgi:hypothetical protein
MLRAGRKGAIGKGKEPGVHITGLGGTPIVAAASKANRFPIYPQFIQLIFTW